MRADRRWSAGTYPGDRTITCDRRASDDDITGPRARWCLHTSAPTAVELAARPRRRGDPLRPRPRAWSERESLGCRRRLARRGRPGEPPARLIGSGRATSREHHAALDQLPGEAIVIQRAGK